MTTKIWIGIVLAIVLVAAIFFAFTRLRPPPPQATALPLATATYTCSGGKSITATYYSGETVPQEAGQPPVPTGSVALSLSDGRTMTLRQTLSADGARYADADGSVVFWNVGNGATFTESGTQAFMGCIVTPEDPGGLAETYANGSEGFSLRYPAGYTVDESYRYQALGPGKDIGGIRFTIPGAFADGTNLSTDSYLSIEELPQASQCSAAPFLEDGAAVRAVVDDGTTYSVGSVSGAAAGNRYEETVYALPGTDPCIGIRYFVHYSAIGNYPEGSVREFDRDQLLKEFDAIRRTLTIAQ